MINKRLDAAKSVSVNLVISCSNKVATWQPALDLGRVFETVPAHSVINKQQ